MILIIDSRDRLPGGTPNSFRVSLRPGLEAVRSARLLYADIVSPEGDTEPYYMIATSLGVNVRGATQGAGATFVIPRSAAAGYRTFHAQESQFPAIHFESPPRGITELDVDVRTHGGSAGLTDEWFMVLDVNCE